MGTPILLSADHLVDVGFDIQCQFLGERDAFSVPADFINENRSLTASHAVGLSTNSHDRLQSVHVKATYWYEQTYGLTAGYFQIQGTADAGRFSATSVNNSPNSDGWIAELDYMPFNYGGPSIWPWLNAKFALQYIYYDKFNGGRTNDVTATFRSADILKSGRVIFDIGGNKYRLVAAVHYRGKRVYVRFIGTHKEYDRIDVERV